MVTPLTADEQINEKWRRLTNHLIDSNHGVFAVGSQGEFWAFTPEGASGKSLSTGPGLRPVHAGTVG
jgi:hypothetical protein